LGQVAARLPRRRGTIHVLPVLAALALAAPAFGAANARVETSSAALGASAARGLDRGLFVSSPGGVFATAARVAQWRPLVRRAARSNGVDPNLLEAIVLVESSGRADAVNGSSAGLTQIAARVAKGRLHLRVNAGRSRALTRRIDHAEARGAFTTARQLRRWRARYDVRFVPATSLRATARYLRRARRALGRADLAVAAYHLGLGRLEAALRSYGAEEPPTYAQLYFGSAPDAHRRAWRLLAGGGEYYWKVLAAKRVLRLYRHDRAALAFEQRQQWRKNSAEEVLHPAYRTSRFASPGAIALAWRRHVLRAIPRDARRTHIAIARSFGDQAHKLGRSRRLYRGLRPATLDVLLYVGRRVHELSGSRKPLMLTSALRDDRYQRVLLRVNANAARTYSIHTTGYAFDIARSYASSRQAAAFQFVLDRLVAANAIAYIREAGAIHVAVASDARRKLALLARAR
jgi:Family of unknown function (DUF5715)/Transglycosylase SLT domain